MSSIHTLIPDIYELLKRGGWDAEAEAVSKDIVSKIKASSDNSTRTPGLRLSKMGPCCPKALWCSIHTPELAEPLPPWATFKYTYGHIIEALAISLAKRSGHEVTGEQDELTLDGIRGHRDCVIDGCVVDVKSCSSIQFAKYKTGSVAESDSFGYLDQLDGYVLASRDDPLVRTKDRGYILAIDKTLGHMCLYEHHIREERIRSRIREYKGIVGLSAAPSCTCGTVPDGKSGNIRLDIKASYSPHKYNCFPNLRAFLYASGPVYLTHVARKPDVPEIDKLGNIIYN